MNELHQAVHEGSIEGTLAVLSRGVIDIDQGYPEGSPPLILAAAYGDSRVVRALLDKGASMCVVREVGYGALHVAVLRGHLVVTKMLVKAGADLDAKSRTTLGCTPLYLAAEKGHSEMMKVLIGAGANPNSRGFDGATSLFVAAQFGQVDAIKVLLRVKADPLLTRSSTSGNTWLPLDIAAQKGHLEVVHELIQEHGIEGCGGSSNGVDALCAAAETQHVEVMRVLTGAGVVDTGTALRGASWCGKELSVKFLLQQQEWKASGEGSEYQDTPNRSGVPRTLAVPPIVLLCSIEACHARITRLLVDAGADTTTAVRIVDITGVELFDGTPLAYTNFKVRSKKIRGKEATEEQLHRLEATRRLLLRVEAVHAISWLWAREAPYFTPPATAGAGKTKANPAPLTLILPILRRRVQRPRALLAALFRHSGKPY